MLTLFILNMTVAHFHPVLYFPQGCRSSYRATCRAASFRRLSTTSAVNLRAILCAKAATAGVSAARTSPSVTVLSLTCKIWKATCCASETIRGLLTRSLKNQVSQLLRHTKIGPENVSLNSAFN